MSENYDYQNKTKIGLIMLIIITLVCFSLIGCSSKSKIYHVGILSGLDPLSDTIYSFKTKMMELDYIEGKNIVYDIQKTNFEHDKELQILNKFIEDKVDLIFTFPDTVTEAAKKATQGKDIPVVFAFTTIEGTNLIDNIRQPGGNMTGVRELGLDIFVKRLEILHELVPQAKRIYIPYDPEASPINQAVLDALHKAASQMNIKLVEEHIKTTEEIKANLQVRNKSADIGIDAILLIPGTTATLPSLKVLNRFATEHKIPIGGLGIYTIKEIEYILFGYEIMRENVGTLVAILTNKILKGTSAGTIPVVTPEPYLLINYKLANKLKLKVPESILSQANEIIR